MNLLVFQFLSDRIDIEQNVLIPIDHHELGIAIIKCEL